MPAETQSIFPSRSRHAGHGRRKRPHSKTAASKRRPPQEPQNAVVRTSVWSISCSCASSFALSSRLQTLWNSLRAAFVSSQPAPSRPAEPSATGTLSNRALEGCQRMQGTGDPQQQNTRGLPENARHRGPLSNKQHSRAVREKTSAQGYAHRERSKTVMPSASAWYGSAPKSSSVSTVLKVVWFTMGMTAIISGVCAQGNSSTQAAVSLAVGLLACCCWLLDGCEAGVRCP